MKPVQTCGNHSLWRALKGGETHVTVYDGEPTRIVTWWQAILEVAPGDRVRWFETPWGLAVEAVEPQD